MFGVSSEPQLSICIPTYNRPDLLERALGSIAQGPCPPAGTVEIVISDNSTDERSKDLCAPVLAAWNGPTQYVLNRPGVGAEPNFNRCLQLGTGRWVHILHDDDYLTRGPAPILDAINSATDADRVLLFGVRVVDEHERTLKRQTFRSEVRMTPSEALSHVLSDSSWVRFPALVAHREAYDEVGQFDVQIKNPTDFDMWIRLFSRFGVRCLPAVSCCYTVHSGALTDKMFSAATIDTLGGIFDRVVDDRLLPEEEVRPLQADFLHQFILGASWRRVRKGDLAGARELMQLFSHPVVRDAGLSKRWAVPRAVFGAVSLVPLRQQRA